MEEETSKTTAEISDDFKTKPEIPAELPFQLQMKYTNKEGETLLRVFTHFKPSTKDRMEAEKSKCMYICNLKISVFMINQ